MRKTLTLLLLLLLPLQGIAAAFAPVHLALNAVASTPMPCHDHGATHAAADEAAATNTAGLAPAPDVPREADAPNHQCCYQIFTCAPARALMPSAHKFSDVPRFVPLYTTLFIPDSLERPPRD